MVLRSKLCKIWAASSLELSFAQSTTPSQTCTDLAKRRTSGSACTNRRNRLTLWLSTLWMLWFAVLFAATVDNNLYTMRIPPSKQAGMLHTWAIAFCSLLAKGSVWASFRLLALRRMQSQWCITTSLIGEQTPQYCLITAEESNCGWAYCYHLDFVSAMLSCLITMVRTRGLTTWTHFRWYCQI